MKKQTLNLDGPWFLARLEPGAPLPKAEAASADWLKSDALKGVHEILLDKGMIRDPRGDNDCAALKWIGESDWVYWYSFPEDLSGHMELRCDGLDTVAEVFLNGKLLASHDDMYLPFSCTLPDIAAGDALMLRFFAPEKLLADIKLPENCEGCVDKLGVLRKSKHDFTCFAGQHPYLALVGPYAELRLIRWGEARLRAVDIRPRLEGEDGLLRVSLETEGSADGARIRVENLQTGLEAIPPVEIAVEAGRAQAEIFVPGVDKWWPRSYGAQNLYRVRAELLRGGEAVDGETRSVGFCRCEIGEDFVTSFNGLRIRLWGANFAPMDGWTHRWDGERFERILDLAENAHMNLLRVWGGGFPYPNALYEACSRRGILIWQDFFHDYGMTPDTEAFFGQCLREAECLVRRVAHFPCVALWCGGNETFLGAEYLMPEKPYLGAELFTERYRKLCEKLDPDRRYHVNSPYGGAFANDPRIGDTHSYGHDWFVPGLSLPRFVTENNRSCTPCVQTLRRMIASDRLWPSDFRDEWTRSNRALMPDSWQEWMVPAARNESGALQDYYEAESAEELVYKFGASARDHIRQSVENCRRGKAPEAPDGPFVCGGHMLWKLNDTWPSIYCGSIDYYLLPNMSYYAMKHSYKPVIVSFEGSFAGDRLALWLVNDSTKPVSGKLRVGVFAPEENRSVRETVLEAACPAGDSKRIAALDTFGQIRRTQLLYAQFVDGEGAVLDQKTFLLAPERRYAPTRAKVDIAPLGDGRYRLSSDRYAHCVQIEGTDADGASVVFSDNDFSLLPGWQKIVRALGKAPKTLCARDASGRI